MDPAWWSKDRTLNASDVARIVDLQFPDLAGSPTRFLDEGWDSEVFEVGGEWILRFAKRRDVAEHLDKEVQVLWRVADRVPVAVPRFELFGEPCDDFPYRFNGYRKIPGVAAIDRLDWLPSAGVDEVMARQLGETLGVVHGLDPAELGVELGRFQLDLQRPFDEVEDRMSALVSVDPELATRVAAEVASLRTPMPASRYVVVHGDLDAEHVLVDDANGRVTGIIDWADLELCVPASDFVGIYGWRGPAFLERVLAHYDGPVSPADFEWIRQRSIRVALGNVAYGRIAEKPAHLNSGLHSLRTALAAG